MDTILFGWPYAGLLLAAALSAWLWRSRADAVASSLALVWPMYLVHQFEEHGIDARGHHFAFLGDICGTLGYAVADCPADAAFIFAVNALGCQAAFAIAWFAAGRRPSTAACVWGIPLVNGVAHTGSAIFAGSYNAGLLTALLLFLPLSVWVLRGAVRKGAISVAVLPLVVLSGVLVHGVLIGSLLLRARGVLPESGLLAVNALNGLTPVAVSALAKRRR